MNTQNIETIEGAKPCLIGEKQANELIEANTQEMEEIEDLLTSSSTCRPRWPQSPPGCSRLAEERAYSRMEKCQAQLCLSCWTTRQTRTAYQKA